MKKTPEISKNRCVFPLIIGICQKAEKGRKRLSVLNHHRVQQEESNSPEVLTHKHHYIFSTQYKDIFIIGILLNNLDWS